MKWAIAFIALSCCCLAAELLINTYDMTAYLFTEIERVQFEAHCDPALSLTDEIVDVYEPVKIIVDYIPMPKVPLLISEQGFTVSTKAADIVVPEEYFERLVQTLKAGETIKLVVDRYPIEIYPDKIRVVEPVGRDKIQFFLSHFFEKVPKVVGPGEYELAQESVHQLVVSHFPGLGGVVMAIFEKDPEELTFIENSHQTRGLCLSLPPGEHIVQIVSPSGEATLTLNFPERIVRFESSQIELGTFSEKKMYFPSGLQPTERFSYPGRYVALELDETSIVIRELHVRDSLPPSLKLNTKWLDSMCQIQLDVDDVSPVETSLYVDGEKIPMQRGVLRLTSTRHTLIAVAQDAFQNVSYVVRVLERPKELLVFSEEKVVDIGGFKFFSPYVKWQLLEPSSYEVKVNEKTYKIEKRR